MDSISNACSLIGHDNSVKREITISSNGKERIYQLTISCLICKLQKHIGFVIIGTEMTAYKEAKLKVENTALEFEKYKRRITAVYVHQFSRFKRTP